MGLKQFFALAWPHMDQDFFCLAVDALEQCPPVFWRGAHVDDQMLFDGVIAGKRVLIALMQLDRDRSAMAVWCSSRDCNCYAPGPGSRSYRG